MVLTNIETYKSSCAQIHLFIQQSDTKKPLAEINLATMSIAVAVGLLFCAVSQTVGNMFSVSPMLLVSTFAVMAATLFPKAMGSISASGGIIGVLAMQVVYILHVLSVRALSRHNARNTIP